MKKLVLLLTAALLTIGGWALAQNGNITKSIQLSQDGTGPIGFDQTNNVFFPRKVLFPSTATTPVLSGCGTTPTIVGNDVVGKLTTGSAATTCTITFSQAYIVAPACFLQTQGSATQPTYTTSTTAITVTVDIASTVYNYFCASQG